MNYGQGLLSKKLQRDLWKKHSHIDEGSKNGYTKGGTWFALKETLD